MVKLLEYQQSKRTRITIRLAERETYLNNPWYTKAGELFPTIYIVTPSGIVFISKRRWSTTDHPKKRHRPQDNQNKRLKVEGGRLGSSTSYTDGDESDSGEASSSGKDDDSPMDGVDPLTPTVVSEMITNRPSDPDCTSPLPPVFGDFVDSEAQSSKLASATLILSGLTCYGLYELPITPRLVGPIFEQSMDAQLSEWDSHVPLLGKLGRILGRGRMGVVHSMEVEGFPDRLVIKLGSPMLEGYISDCPGREYVQAVREMEVYERQLKHLQGRVVPRFYGLWQSSSSTDQTIYGLVLDHAGEPMQQYSLSPTEKAKIRIHYIALHKAGVVHDSARLKHWYRSPEGIRLIDFGSSRTRSIGEKGWGMRVDKEIDKTRSNLRYIRSQSGTTRQTSDVGIDENWGTGEDEEEYAEVDYGWSDAQKTEMEERIARWLEGVEVSEEESEPAGTDRMVEVSEDHSECGVSCIVKWREGVEYSNGELSAGPDDGVERPQDDSFLFLYGSRLAPQEKQSELVVNVELVELDPPLDQLKLGAVA